MMKKALTAIYCFFVFGVFSFSNANAQKLFVEGELLYAITISQNNPEQKTPNNIQGTLSIKQKGHAVLKELLLKNGFKSTKLFLGQAKPSYSFILIAEQNFALKSDEESLKCNNLTLETLPTDIKSIAGFKIQPASFSHHKQTFGTHYMLCSCQQHVSAEIALEGFQGT